MKILVPVDGSSQSQAALDFVASRTTLLGHEPRIQLINVQPGLSARVVRAIGREEAKAFQRAEADEVLRPAVARLRRAGISPLASYALGGRANAIGAVATKGRADLVVMGSRGHSGLKGLLFGSMTNAVLAGCSTPMLILRSAKAPSQDMLSVGIAIDGSPLAAAAVRWVIRHRDLFGAAPRVELIHVHHAALAEGHKSAHGAARRAQSALARVAANDTLTPDLDKLTAAPSRALAKAGIAATVVHLHGPLAGEAIAAHARRRRLDVLVMGSHGRGAFTSLVLGSVAMRVAALCEVPLLLIRQRERASRPASLQLAGAAIDATPGAPSPTLDRRAA